MTRDPRGPALALLALLSAAACSKDGDKPWFPVTRSHAAASGAGLVGDAPHEAPVPPEPQGYFGERGAGIAFVEPAGATSRVVFDGRVGRPYDAVEDVTLSPDGRRVAYAALRGGRWRAVVDGSEGTGAFDVVRSIVFSPDGAHVAFVARAGASWLVVLDGAAGPGDVRPFVDPAFDASSSRLAVIEGADAAGWGRLTVTELTTGRRTVVAERASNLLVDGRHARVAAVGASGKGMRVLSFEFAHPEGVRRGPEQEAVRQLAFGAGGEALAYVAERGGKRFVYLDDREAPLADGEDPVTPPVVRPDRRGVGLFVLSAGSVVLRQFFEAGPGAGARYEAAEGLVYAPGGRAVAYAAMRNGKWFAVVNGKEGMPFDRVVTPAFSPDGRHLVYRAREEMRRFVVVADEDGKIASLHLAHDQVYPVQFSPDGRSVRYGVKDGAQYAWKSERL